MVLSEVGRTAGVGDSDPCQWLLSQLRERERRRQAGRLLLVTSSRSGSPANNFILHRVDLISSLD